MPNTIPVYNLKAVLRETGLGADTLRAWERRYGVPAPQRTAGGHRLYSEYDIAQLKWLIARQNDGLSISRAVEMWKEQLAQGKDPLDAPARSKAMPSLPPQAIYLPPETGMDNLRAQWLAACLNFNESAAEQTLNQAFSLYPVETVCTDLLARGLSEVGMLWYENRASVQQEHFASNLAMRRLDALIAAAPPAGRPHTILVGCPPEEWHTFTGLLVTLFLRRRGLNVVYLGANVPANRFEETLAAIQPRLVILSSQQLVTAASLQQTAMLLNAHGATVAYGGRIFGIQPGLTERIPGHFLGSSLESGIETVETLLVTRPDAPRPVPPSVEYVEALKAFSLKRPLVENSLNTRLAPLGGNPDYFVTANHFMGDNLRAALLLGDLAYLDTEIDWLNTLIKTNHLSLEVVPEYLKLYSAAIQEHLGDQGQIIVRWADKMINKK
jgi:DNA-binding transcriptional MerR regulator